MKLTNSPSFCYIAPTAYLQATLASTTHLTLAHLVDSNTQYRDFYFHRGLNHDTIIMDNSAYEMKTPYAPERLCLLAKNSGASVVVLPDYPFQQAQQTIDAAVEFIPIFKQNGLKSFFVPQSKRGDLEDWIAAYTWAANNPDIDVIGMSILGIPNALPNIDPAYARVVMTQLLLERGLFAHHKHHHYLGLNAGPALEIPSLLRMGVLDTIDSSGPIWSAILGHQYSIDTDSLQAVRKLKLPVDFNLPATKDDATAQRIKHNIELTQMLFNSYSQDVAWFAQE